MEQLRGRLRFAQEARLDLAAERQLGRQQLDRDLPLQPLVLGTIDDAHAAPADLAVELVVGRQRAFDMGAQLDHPRQRRAGQALGEWTGEGTKRT